MLQCSNYKSSSIPEGKSTKLFSFSIADMACKMKYYYKLILFLLVVFAISSQPLHLIGLLLFMLLFIQRLTRTRIWQFAANSSPGAYLALLNVEYAYDCLNSLELLSSLFWKLIYSLILLARSKKKSNNQPTLIWFSIEV